MTLSPEELAEIRRMAREDHRRDPGPPVSPDAVALIHDNGFGPVARALRERDADQRDDAA